MSSGVTYHHPTIGPKAYMARGTSGWSETFRRQESDEELTKLLGSIPLATAISGFQNQRKLVRGSIDWPTIIDYLKFLCRCDEKMITDGAAVSFWCQYILAEREAKSIKVN